MKVERGPEGGFTCVRMSSVRVAVRARPLNKRYFQTQHFVCHVASYKWVFSGVWHFVTESLNILVHEILLTSQLHFIINQMKHSCIQSTEVLFNCASLLYYSHHIQFMFVSRML